jgi:hypothetical protein
VSDALAISINGPVFLKGTLAVIIGIVLFVGSVYLLLAAVFGVRMGYLVLAVALFGWMILLSALWTFGAPGTLKNLGPRPTGEGAGAAPHWEPFGSGVEAASPRYPVVEQYPFGSWEEPTGEAVAEVEPARGALQEFLAEKANAQLGIEVPRHIPEIAGGGPPPEFEQEPVTPEEFVVTNIRFATVDDTRLVGGQAYFNQGGPEVLVFAYFDNGNVPVYSWVALGISIVGFLVHLPFLDRAERKRKDVLTGGTAPPFTGPA